MDSTNVQHGMRSFVEHSSHEHPLVLQQNDDVIARGALCYVCDRSIGDSVTYICTSRDIFEDCENYYLHKSCAELPPSIVHYKHKDHKLVLKLRDYCSCDICSRHVKSLAYACEDCDFDVCVICSFEQRELLHAGHWEHPLTLMPRNALFECDACGDESKDSSYVCTICDFWIHKGCAMAPLVTEPNYHNHPISLIYSIPNIHRNFRKLCGICHYRVYRSNWMYYCQKCQFFVHMRCAIKYNEESAVSDTDTVSLVQFPLASEKSLFDLFSGNCCRFQVDFQSNDPDIIKEHWSHNHPLEKFQFISMVGKPTDRDVWSPSRMVGVEAEEAAKPLKITSFEPAKHWTDALPIGNGRLGGMIWGGVASDTINLNDDTLWTGDPGNYTNPDAPKVLSEVRKLVDDGKYAEATKAAVNLSGNPSDVYQLLGDIKLEFDESHAAYDEKTYVRELDLDTAIVKVKYTAGGIEYSREQFSSSPDQVIVTNISGSKPGSLSFMVYLDSKLHHGSRVNGQNQIIMEGSCRGKRIAPKSFENEDPMGVQFSAVLDLKISDGTGKIHVVDDKKLKIEGADWAVILLAASSSFDGPFTKASESKKNPTSDSLKVIDSIKKFSYAELSARHLDDYQKLFHRVSLQLSKSTKNVASDECSKTRKHLKATDEKVSTAQRVKSFKMDEDPSFVELLFQYGRYLLISCSRPGTQASNLQGIWNKDVEPAWDGAPHTNINLQMNYWPALPCNLKECQEPLFDYISSLAVNGSKTAKVNYEASGWVVHQVSDIWAKTSPDRGEAVWALWPMGGAWLCTHLWEHYTYTMDKDFLKNKAYPLIEGCALFLLDWLIEGRGGYLETNPSTSPEHMFVAPDGQPASVSYSTTMDMSIIREVFSAVISASEVLGKSQDDLVKNVLKAQSRLYPTKIARDGSIMEWAQDFEDPEVHHRHVSHLFGLFPGHTITLEKTPDLCKAVDYTLYKRGEDGPGWSTTWKAALWARLHSSEHAYRMVKHLVDLVDPDHEADFEGGLYSNLFTAHPPFQIDANFGFCAAIAEMLVQSTTKDLYLLPALPRDKWPNGCVKGLKARGGVTVGICWTEGDLHEIGLWSNNSNSVSTIRLHYRGSTVTTKVTSGRVYTFNKKLKCTSACFL